MSGTLLMGMQPQPAKFFPGVPAREKDLVAWLDKSPIAPLKALVARPIYRKYCDDLVFSKKLWNNPAITKDAKELIINSGVEMENALKKYYFSVDRSVRMDELVICLDEKVCSVRLPVVHIKDLLNSALWHLRSDVIGIALHLGFQSRTLVRVLIDMWKDWPQHTHALLTNFLDLKMADVTDKCNGWPLMIAALNSQKHDDHHYCNSSRLIHKLLSAGADPNAREDDSGQTALMLLCNGSGCASCIRLLLAKNADIEARDDNDKRAIVHAVEASNLEAFKILMDHKACTGFMMGDQTLFDLAKKKPGNAEMVRRLRIAKEERP
jgi:hypothetical protein